MRVLVCGGRDFADSALLYGVLDELNRTKTIICVIEGDARGADRLAGQWARRNHIDLKSHCAGVRSIRCAASAATAQSADARRRQTRSGRGVSGRRRNETHGQARGQGGRGNT